MDLLFFSVVLDFRVFCGLGEWECFLGLCRVWVFQWTGLFGVFLQTGWFGGKSNRKSINKNWSNQKANPALKTKTGNK